MNDKKEKERKVLLPAEAGVLVGENIYFFSSEYNLLYKVDIPDFSVSIVSRIPCNRVIASKWFRKMRYWKGKLILIPSCAEKVWIYELNTGVWTDIDIEHSQIPLKFFGSVIYQDTAFLFGAAYPGILKINLNDYSAAHLDIICPPEQKKEDIGLFCTDAIKAGNIVFSPISISNHVMWLDLDTDKYGWQQIGSAENEYCGIDRDEDGFWIPSWEHGKIVNWDGGEKWEEFELPAEIANRRYQFTGAVCDGDKIRFLSIQDGKSLEIWKDTSGKRQLVLTEETKKYVHAEHYEDGTIVLMRNDGAIDVKWKGTWQKGRCAIDYKDFVTFFGDESLWELLAEKEVVNETEIFAMNDYLKMVTEKQNNNTDFLNERGVGMSIWKTLE